MNQNIRKGAALFFSLLLAGSALLPETFAAAAEPVDIDGTKTAFVSSFGRISYGGKSYTAYKSFDEGYAALSDGGKLVFNGNVSFAGDTLGAGKALSIEGIGKTVTASAVKVESETLSLSSDLVLSDLSLRLAENNRIVLNGHNFTADNFDAYFTIPDYTTGAKKYAPLPNLYSGDASGNYEISLSGGHYGTIAASSGKVSGNAALTISGAEIGTLYLGSLSGETVGEITLSLNDSKIDRLVIGAENGSMKGDVKLTIDGSTVTELAVGAYGADSSFVGNVSVYAGNTSIEKLSGAGEGKTEGGAVYFVTGGTQPAIDEKAHYDQILYLSGGKGEPTYDENGVLTGVTCYDVYGCRAASLLLSDGTTLAPENGVFKLEKGLFIAEIKSGLDLRLRKDASFVSGYSDGTFRPNGNMTRAEAVTLLTRLIADYDAVKNGKFESEYTDLSPEAWYYNNISFFEKSGLLKNVTTDGGDANPNAPITRGEFVQLIYNINHLLPEEETYADFKKLCQNIYSNIANAKNYDEFSDVNYNDPHNNAIYFALANGYMVGYADGTFRPDGTVTRAEVVTVVNRYLGRIPHENETSAFSDIADSWAKTQIAAAVGKANEAYTASASLTALPDGKSFVDYVKELSTEKKPTALVTTMTNRLYKTASHVLSAKDISAEEKAVLSAALDELKTAGRTKGNPKVYNGSADDLDTYVYGNVGDVFIRETVIEGRKPGTDPVEIVQISDTHFNLVNEYDLSEANPAVMSTKIYRTWLANGASQPNAIRAMEYARYADQTVVTGDILDYLSYGCKELTIKNLFRKDTDIMACLGGHDVTRVMQGKVSDPSSYESRIEWLRKFWPHDVYYSSKVVKDKVMCVALDNGMGKYFEEQATKLAADIEKARREGLVILIFEHEPLCTHNPEDHEIHPFLSYAADGLTNSFDNDCIGKDGTSGATLAVYNLIRNNADVVRGVFCGHYHGDYITHILGSYTDEAGNKVEKTIPQYVLTANAYGTGHVMKITVT